MQLYFEISLLSLIHEIFFFLQKFYQHVAVYEVRIWTYKIEAKMRTLFYGDEKA